MFGQRLALPIGVVLAAAVCAGSLPGARVLAVGGAADAADTLRQKVASITQIGAKPDRQLHRTTVTQDEVNAYFAPGASTDLPTGVVEASVSILGTGRLSARAIVDLDAVRRQKTAPSLLDPTSYLTGRLPITAVGVLKTNEGLGWFQFESATVGGVPVPKTLLQEIVSYYSRTPGTPAGVNLDDSFALPARIREIQVERGQAIIIQ
jgi:hypothetical protein